MVAHKLANLTGPDKMIPPRVTHKVEPEMTTEARRANFAAGRVLLSIVVAPNGRACGIRVYSPLGLGLDEAAIRAIRQWRFSPATRAGQPVALKGTVEVNFRMAGYGIDGDEVKRGRFNEAVDSIRSQDPKEVEKALTVIKELSDKKYPSADGLLALYYLHGDHVPQDSSQGILLAQRANKKNDRLGIYALGYAYEQGLGVPQDETKAFSLYSEASTLGLTLAQLRIARAYASGKPFPIDMQRAERTYRLCAAQGSGECAYELAALLQAQKEPDHAEIGAWALIAQELGVKEAKALLEPLSPDTLKEASTLKTAILDTRRAF
jgi:TonB family protein